MTDDKQLAQDGFSVRLALAENADGTLTVLRCLDPTADDINIELETGERPVAAIAPHAFENCRQLVRVILPPGLRQIGEMAFLGCQRLSRVVIPGSVEKIGGLAFARCTSLIHVVLQPGVAALGPSCFSKCSRLARVDIPASVRSFGGGVFFGCGKQLVLYGAENAPAAAYARQNGIAYDAERWREDPVFRFEEQSDGSLTLLGVRAPQPRLVVPQEFCGRRIAAIAPKAFFGDTALMQIVLGAGVCRIGESAFMGCVNLEHVSTERGLIEIGSSAFAGCENLPQIVLPAGLSLIGRMAFFGCTRLSFVKLPPTTRVEALAFEGCSPALRIYGGVPAERA